MDYPKRTDNKESFTKQVFKLFTDACGGDPEEFADVLYSKFTVEDFGYSDDSCYFNILSFFQKSIIPHKIEVCKAGMEFFKNSQISKYLNDQQKFDFQYNLWIHDISKFSADEAFGYAMYNRSTGHGKQEFELAWHHHKMNNPHHPEHWLNPNRSGTLEPLPMPNMYILEMIADWIGAGKTYGSTLEEWLPKNIDKFLFAEPKKVAEMIMVFTGINVDVNPAGRIIIVSQTLSHV